MSIKELYFIKPAVADQMNGDGPMNNWAHGQGSFDKKIIKEIAKAQKRFGEAFDEEQFKKTNPNVLRNASKIESIEKSMKDALNANDLKGLRQLIVDLEIACPLSGSREWTEVRQFNLMFATEIGSVAGESSKIYLRPETAQGIFVNFLNVQKSGRMKIPFGIAQIGKAFRNEIIARQFIFRMREFEQMEMQFFVQPGEEMKWYDYWKSMREKWHKNLGLGDTMYRFHDHIKMAHYANAACDIEFDFPMGFKELEGIHSRTDFDLKQHEEHSGKKLAYFDPELNKSYVPYVIETSIGLDRMFLAVLSASFNHEILDDQSKRIVLRIPPALAPIKAAILPLVKKDGLPEIAEEIANQLKFEYNIQIDLKDSIGKRYRRQDAIGTPICITVDHDTKNDQSVTIRYRDTMKQERIQISELPNILEGLLGWKTLLSNLTE